LKEGAKDVNTLYKSIYMKQWLLALVISEMQINFTVKFRYKSSGSLKLKSLKTPKIGKDVKWWELSNIIGDGESGTSRAGTSTFT
jgi:hypothetical protein